MVSTRVRFFGFESISSNTLVGFCWFRLFFQILSFETHNRLLWVHLHIFLLIFDLYILS